MALRRGDLSFCFSGFLQRFLMQLFLCWIARRRAEGRVGGCSKKTEYCQAILLSLPATVFTYFNCDFTNLSVVPICLFNHCFVLDCCGWLILVTLIAIFFLISYFFKTDFSCKLLLMLGWQGLVILECFTWNERFFLLDLTVLCRAHCYDCCSSYHLEKSWVKASFKYRHDRTPMLSGKSYLRSLPSFFCYTPH